MAHFGGMSMESFSSAHERLSSASSGLGSLLRDQKGTTGIGCMNMLLGFSSPLAGAAGTSHSLYPLSSSPTTDSNGVLVSDEVELKDEDLWGSDLSEDDTRSHPPDPLYRHRLMHAYEFSSAYSQMSFFTYRGNGDHNLKPAGTGTGTGPAYGDALKQGSLLLLDGVHPVYDLAVGKSTEMPLSSRDVISTKSESKLFSTVRKPSEPCRVASHISSRTISRAVKCVVLDSQLEVEHQSAPMNVPNWSKILQNDTATLFDCTEKVDDNDNEERLPPHELLAREYAQKERMTFSVCEGQGRTLKGRDMRRVRNAVWRQIGFAD